MTLYNIYSDSHNYRIPYKFENDTVHFFRCFKTDAAWIIETQSFMYSKKGMVMFFNDDVDSDGCNNLTKLFTGKIRPMKDKHYTGLVKFIFTRMLK